MKSVVVPKEAGQDAVERLKERAALLHDRKIVPRNGKIIIPVLEGPAREAGFEVVETGDTPSRRVRSVPYDRIRERCGLPDDLENFLPDRWELLGDVLILDLPPELIPHGADVAKAYAGVLGARAVLNATGAIEGEFRLPKLEPLLGDSFETVHLENGIRYSLDPSRVMFSSGNIDERIRMGRMNMRGEKVVDMFAGIGYFTLPMARHGGARVTAWEKNPVAFEYLERNIVINGLLERVDAHLGDNRDAEEGTADRVLMGYMGGTHRFLDKALRLLEGRGVVHYHDGFHERELWDTPFAHIDGAVKRAGGGWKMLDRRIVKSYARRRYHVVIDILYMPEGTSSPEPERISSS